MSLLVQVSQTPFVDKLQVLHTLLCLHFRLLRHSVIGKLRISRWFLVLRTISWLSNDFHVGIHPGNNVIISTNTLRRRLTSHQTPRVTTLQNYNVACYQHQAATGNGPRPAQEQISWSPPSPTTTNSWYTFLQSADRSVTMAGVFV